MSKLRINKEGWIKLSLSLMLLTFSVAVSIEKNLFVIFFPMLASIIGDILIMSSRGCCTGKKENSFEYGIIAFAVAHLFYISIMPTQISFGILIAGFAFVTAIVFVNENRIVASALYAIVLILSTINAFFFHPLAFTGMILFIISDVILVIFEEKDPRWQIPIWIFYVAGQICLLTSLLLN